MSGQRSGWVDSPDTRGTADIIWPCISTVVLCLYTMLHLNLPAPEDGMVTQSLRKVRWLLLGLLAPELPMLFAFAQRASARKSVQEMNQIGHHSWSLTHGFFTDSGGFVLAPEGMEPFPLTARQMVYLVRQGYIEIPKTTTLEIKDKSKASTAAKSLAAFQAIRFILILVSRAAYGLQTTPLELFSAAVVSCCIVTMGFWRSKPLDVDVPVVIHFPFRFINPTGSGPEPHVTPLDFLEPRIYWSTNWGRGVEALLLRLGLQERPLKRIPNDRDFKPSSLWENLCLGAPVCAFGSIHLLGWNLHFPGPLELLFWRVNSVIALSALIIYGLTEIAGFWWSGYEVTSMDVFGGYKKRLPWCAFFHVLSTLYFLSRLGLVFEAVYSMRDLPQDAFHQVKWAQWVPRFS